MLIWEIENIDWVTGTVPLHIIKLIQEEKSSKVLQEALSKVPQDLVMLKSEIIRRITILNAIKQN